MCSSLWAYYQYNLHVGPVWLRVEVRKRGSVEVVIVPFGIWELVSKFSGVWMLLRNVI